MNNLQKRIFTSFILFAVLLICIFLNKYLFLILVIIASVISFFEFNNLIYKIWKKNVILKNAINIISFFYLLFFIFSTFSIYEKSLESIILILLICIFSDIGGYFIGKIIGGKKLTKISPNKTISGSVGSFAFSLIPIVFYKIYLDNVLKDIFLFIPNYFLVLVLMSLLVSFMCQLGDLFISYFKRKAKVKDTGTLLPGHGGVLDRIDGIMFALPGALIIDKMIILYS